MSSAAALITAAANQYGVPPTIAIGVAQRESGMNQNVPNGAAGEIGMFQLLPSTAAMLGVDPTVESQNIQGGVMYLAELYAEFGDWPTAVAAYNWGPGNVSKAIAHLGPNWLSSAPAGTQAYVEQVVGVLPAQEAASYNRIPEGLPPLASTGTADETTYSVDDTNSSIDEMVPPNLKTDLTWAGLLVAGVGAWAIGSRL